MVLELLFAVCTPFVAEELEGSVDAACVRRMNDWKVYVSSYRPDYSDSTHFLEPPPDNRLEKPFAVVSGGKPSAAIVLIWDSKEDIVLRQAAVELRDHVKLLTGVELPIWDHWNARDDRRAPMNRICLGKRLCHGPRGAGFAEGVWAERIAQTDGGCGKDGFAIRLDPEKPTHLHVFGTTSKGTMNGVFALLENNTDIIWARPNEAFGTVFTPTPGELSFVWGKDFVSVPDTVARGWNSYAGLEWMSRNGCNLFNGGGGGNIAHVHEKKARYGVWSVRYWYGHMFSAFLRDADDPLVYAHDEKGVPFPSKRKMPCFTNPKALDLFSERLINAARMAPTGTERMYVSMEDSWTTCACSNCLAPIRLPDGTLLTKDAENFWSMRFWTFMNKAVERLNAVLPRMKIDTLAYFYTAPVPPCEINPNLTPEFAPYVRANDKVPIFAPENVSWLKRLVGWSRKCKTVEMYDYYGLGIVFPRPLAETRAFDFAVMNPFVVGMTSENNTFADKTEDSHWGRLAEAVWDVSAMEQWVMTRLYWNCRQDVEQLRKRFIRRTYRESAPEIERVYGRIRQEWFASPRRSTLGDDPMELTKQLIVSCGHVTEISNLLETAVAKAQHPKSKILAGRLKDRLLGLVTQASDIKNPKVALPLVRVKGEPGFDDPVWGQAAKLQPFTIVDRTNRNRKARNETAVHLFHDADRLHIRIRCADPCCALIPKTPASPDGKEHPSADDHLELFLVDPKNENDYVLLAVSPEGRLFDWRRNSGMKWEGDWSVRTRRDAGSWEAVLTIPLKTVSEDGDTCTALKALILREVHAHGDLKDENSSWGGGGWHQCSLFGDVKLLR